MGLLSEIENRISVRRFKDEPISPEVMKRILDAGRRAPSAKNRQAWRFVVIDNPELKARIADAAWKQESILEAPSIIAVCSTNIGYKMPNKEPSYPIDLSIAASFMMIQAEHEGLGSCVNTTYDEQRVRDILTVPYSMKVVMLLLLGKAEGEQKKESRLPLDRIVSYNHW